MTPKQIAREITAKMRRVLLGEYPAKTYEGIYLAEHYKLGRVRDDGTFALNEDGREVRAVVFDLKPFAIGESLTATRWTCSECGSSWTEVYELGDGGPGEGHVLQCEACFNDLEVEYK